MISGRIAEFPKVAMVAAAEAMVEAVEVMAAMEVMVVAMVVAMADMVHTLIILVLLQDMQHLVLLPCMIIRVLFMEVRLSFTGFTLLLHVLEPPSKSQ